MTSNRRHTHFALISQKQAVLTRYFMEEPQDTSMSTTPFVYLTLCHITTCNKIPSDLHSVSNQKLDGGEGLGIPS